MAEAAALGLMEAQGIACRQHMSQASDKLCQTKPEPVKRPEKTAKAHPKTEISEEKTLKPSEKMAMSEPSGDSSRHAGSASTEEAERKMKKKKKKGLAYTLIVQKCQIFVSKRLRQTSSQ
ncbi:unnamed protein product [Durusdinium trenchii]|uniref:Uncharacterized protein n=1 Tax=Durusdinium trenchii TaxID=1381693 RepID=A0ABP0JNX0_9DINO